MPNALPCGPDPVLLQAGFLLAERLQAVFFVTRRLFRWMYGHLLSSTDTLYMFSGPAYRSQAQNDKEKPVITAKMLTR
jgi:hypothetical protein